MKLSIIIPVFNEEATIEKIISKVKSVKFPIKWQIIVVNDGSDDKTSLILAKIKSSNVKIVNHRTNLGKGAAIRTGIKHAQSEIIAIQDADLEYDPNDLPRLADPILKGKAKVVYGSRFINYPLVIWGKKRTLLPSHWIANKVLNFLFSLLYQQKITDLESGHKLFKKEVAPKLESNGFDIEVELTAKFLKNGQKILELPIKTAPRGYDEGKKIKTKDGLIAIWKMLSWRFTKQ